MAIDLGTRRVGLALSDEGGSLATPLEVLTISSPKEAIERVVRVIVREGVMRVVIGLPLNMDDSSGPAAKQAILWGNELAARIGKPVVYVDERLSSFDAEQSLNARKRAGEKLTRQRRKEQLDAIAAAQFLQGYLDGRIEAIEPDDR